MTKHILFIQGAGEGAYEADQALVESLRHALGAGYEVHYPAMPDEDNASYQQWKARIKAELAALPEPIVLIGHSVGGSILVKALSEIEAEQPIASMFLLATPFWGGAGWRYAGYEQLALANRFADRLPKGMAIFLYHCRDDETVPFDHLSLYAQVLPQAAVRQCDVGGHQLNNDLSEVAKDVKSLLARRGSS